MLAAIVGILLGVIIVIVLVYPFVGRRMTGSNIVDPVERVASADTLRHLLYREPVTLRNEFESGNITDDEYEEQLAELRERAARLMRDRAERRTQLLEAELALEREVQRIRQVRVAGGVRDDEGQG